MMWPPKVCVGDAVGVVAPSGSFEAARLAPGLGYLRGRGFGVREGRFLYARERYLAGRDGERAGDVNAMFRDPEVTAVFAARGGYGSARVLARLDWEAIEAHPKALVGFSDTTALQLGVLARTGLVTFSGVALCSDVTAEGLHPVTEASLWAGVCAHRFEPVTGLTALRSGLMEGPLIGGCLSLVASLLGTPFFPDVTGAILFLEDVNEPPYRVDRLLNQLRMAGVFERASGLVLGQFVGCAPEREAEGTVQQVLDDLVEQVACPVYANLPYGHGPGRRVLPIGAPAQVKDSTLCFGGAEGA